jgi:ribonuclease P protein component
VLAAAHRLTDANAFRETTRRGRRASSRTLVLHVSGPPSPVGEPRVGFVVSRAVGGSVVRHRVQRRLRHLVREHVTALPAGATVVVRAQPAAAVASYEELGRDLAGCLDRVARIP